jgi:hypothetical protein
MAALWDMFDGAVRVLVGAGPVKQRLSDAWRDHLAPLHDKDLPEPLRARLSAVRAAVHTAHAAGGMSAPEVSVRKMSDKDAAEHAVRILEIYAQLSSMTELETVPRLRVVGGEDHGRAEELPAFLSRA